MSQWNSSRRRLLEGAGAAALLAAGGSSMRLALAQESVAVLGILPLTGPYAADGERIRRGHEMAVEDFGGEVAGLKVDYVSRDTGGDAGTATRRVAEAIESENVTAIAGPWADDVAAAVSEVAAREKRVHYWSGGPIECHRYYFQWAPPYYTGVRATMEHVLSKNPDAKRWYRLTSDYAFGWTLEELEDRLAEEHGIEFVGSTRHVLGEREFSRFMSDISAANPDVLVLNNFGLDTAQAIRSAHSFGLTERTQIMVPWGSGIEDYLRLDPAITQGIVVGSAYYYTVDNPQAQDFAERYIERFDEPPGYPAGSGYAVMRLLLQGIEKAKSASAADLVRAMEGWELDTIVGPTRIEKATHQTLRPFFVTEGKASDEVSGEFDLARIVNVAQSDPPADVIACEDIGEL